MVPELENPRVTELQVRMDCNGCVQKIKRAMHNIEGVYGVYVDFAQQKLTVVGRYDPEKIVKAIKKTRKAATICSHTEPGSSEQPPPPEPAASGEPPPADAANQQPPPPPPSEIPPTPVSEPPKDAPEVAPSQDAKDAAAAPDPPQNNIGEIPMVHHYPQSYIHREQWNHYPLGGHEIRYESPYYVTHSYSNHRTSPYLQTEYHYTPSPPRDIRYYEAGSYNERYNYLNRGPGDGQHITSIFSDENPNACSIV